LSKETGIHPSTVSRILHLLQRNDFLQQDPGTKKYSLGMVAAELGTAIIQSLRTRIVTIAEPYALGLRDSIKENVSLEVMVNHHAVKAYEVQSPQHVVVVSVPVGTLLPMHVVSGAKAMLAFCSDAFVDSCLSGKLTRFTPNTITNLKSLKEQFGEIRRQGVAFDRGEWYEDVYAMAAPIFSHEKKPIAALAVSVPKSRIESHMKSKTISLLKKTAEKISEQLFYKR